MDSDGDLVSTFLYNVPSGSYYYQSYNSDGVKVVEGWFTMEENDSTISGEWHFAKIGHPEGIGPQVGDGVLTGGYQTDSLWIELNPDFRDNNLQLYGMLDDDMYAGRWMWITYAGISSAGIFTADYKE